MGLNLQPAPGESMETWAARVQNYEYGRALMMLAQGQEPAQVMEETSRRILRKLQHPVLQTLHEAVLANMSKDLGLEHYRQVYINRVGPHADHIRET